MISDLSALLSAAEGYQPDLVAFLRDLVRIPTVNGRDLEVPLAIRIEQEAHKLGLKSRLVALQPERPNILVSYGEGADQFALIAHMDTVAEGNPEGWSSPPFSAEIIGGNIIGRGSADNKAGIACGLYTLAVLRELNLIDPARQQVVVAGVVDEESGACSPLGVRHLLDSGALKARGAIYAYTSDIVCIGHRGLVRLSLKAKGQSVHAGLAEWHNHLQGANAVMALADLLLKLESMNLPAKVPQGFEHLGFTLTPGTIFQGGSYPSVVPDSASAVVDIRLLPGQSSAEVLERVREQIQLSGKGTTASLHRDAGECGYSRSAHPEGPSPRPACPGLHRKGDWQTLGNGRRRACQRGLHADRCGHPDPVRIRPHGRQSPCPG